MTVARAAALLAVLMLAVAGARPVPGAAADIVIYCTLSIRCALREGILACAAQDVASRMCLGDVLRGAEADDMLYDR